MSDHTEEIRARVESYRDVTEVNRVQSLRANFCDKHREICECSTGPCVMCGAAALRKENARLKGVLEEIRDHSLTFDLDEIHYIAAAALSSSPAQEQKP